MRSGTSFGSSGAKSLSASTGHIDHIAPGFGLRIVLAGSSCHYVGIYINRINRIAHCNPCYPHCKYLLNIATVTFCSIGNKNFVRINITATMPYNHSPQLHFSKIHIQDPVHSHGRFLHSPISSQQHLCSAVNDRRS